jgi:hypothetical protein
MFGCGAGVVLTDAVVAGAPHAAITIAMVEKRASGARRRRAPRTEVAEWEWRVTVVGPLRNLERRAAWMWRDIIDRRRR